MDQRESSSSCSKQVDLNVKLEGILHNLSPRNPEKFEYGLETKDVTYRVNCYSPVKRKLFKDGKSVTVTNFKKTKYGVNVINVDEAEVVDSELSFQPTKIAGEVQVSSLTKCVKNQCVDIKGVISKLGKERSTSDGLKRDCCLTDTTGSVKLILYGDHCQAVNNGMSYLLKNVRVMSDDYRNPVIYTAKDICSIDKIKSIKVGSDAPSFCSPSNEREIKGEIMAIDYIEKFKKCMKCKKKIKASCDSPTVECTNPECKLRQKTKALIPSMFARVLCQDSENKTTQNLVLFDDIISKLIPSATQMTVQEVEMSLLDLPESVITYTLQSKAVVDIVIDV